MDNKDKILKSIDESIVYIKESIDNSINEICKDRYTLMIYQLKELKDCINNDYFENDDKKLLVSKMLQHDDSESLRNTISEINLMYCKMCDDILN